MTHMTPNPAGVIVLAVDLALTITAQTPGEIAGLHLAHVTHEPHDRQLHRRDCPRQRLLDREVAELAEELVALIVEPGDEIRSLVARVVGLAPS